MESNATIYLDSTASGFSRQPHLFAQALGRELRETHLKEEAILHYVDSILICNPTMEASDQNTTEVLNFLETWVTSSPK